MSLACSPRAIRPRRSSRAIRASRSTTSALAWFCVLRPRRRPMGVLLILLGGAAMLIAGRFALASYFEIARYMPEQFRDHERRLVSPDIWAFASWVPREIQIRYQRQRVAC